MPSDADRFIEYLRFSIAMGAAHLASKKGTCPADPSTWGCKTTVTSDGKATYEQGSKIGWNVEKKYILILKRL